MGTEAAWVPLVVAALGAGATYVNTEQTNKKQDRAALEAIRNQRAIQDRTDAKVMQTLSDVEASSPAAERQKAADEYLKQVMTAQQVARANLQKTGYSDAYDEEATQSGQQAQDYATQVGGLMASIDAPTAQRTREGFRFGDLASDLGRVASESRGQAWVDELKRRSIRRNPYLDAAAAAASGYDGAGGGGGTAAGDWTSLTGTGLGGGYSSVGGYGALFGP